MILAPFAGGQEYFNGLCILQAISVLQGCSQKGMPALGFLPGAGAFKSTTLIKTIRCYDMNQNQDSREHAPYAKGGGSADGCARQAPAAGPRLCRTGTLAIAVITAVALAGGWVAPPALADARSIDKKDSRDDKKDGRDDKNDGHDAPRPPLMLEVSGPVKARAGVPLEGMTVRLANTGLALRDSRLRLFVHDQQERSVDSGDIKIEVREKNAWKPVLAEPIDEGVMGAIGAEGEAHKEPHKNGGFALGNKANKVLQLRLTFAMPGRYTLVLSVTPDNGETQLAQPVSVDLEVL